MKRLISIFSMAFALCANDVFIYDFTGQPELSEVINNKVNNNTTAQAKEKALLRVFLSKLVLVKL